MDSQSRVYIEYAKGPWKHPAPQRASMNLHPLVWCGIVAALVVVGLWVAT